MELFKSSKANISEHIKNIFCVGELDASATVRKFRTVRKEGTRKVPQPLALAARKFNEQYGALTLTSFTLSHDRFLIIDRKKLYLIGASLKDLGKKWFGVTEMDSANIPRILEELNVI